MTTLGERMTTAGRPSGLTRRQLLSSAVGAGVALGGGSLAARALAAAARVRPRGHGLDAIEHVVILMQENRSFDHYFGTYSGVRGFSDPHVIHQPGGLPVFAQPGYPPGRNPDGFLLPFRFNTVTGNGECVPGPSNEWTPMHQAWANGAMDGFVRAELAAAGAANGPMAMGYYTGEDLPFHHALANAFTICDGYHCSVLGDTDPNRFMSVSGTLDPAGQAGGPILNDSIDTRTLRWKTMPEALEEAGVSWKVYQSPEQVEVFLATPGSNNTANNVLAYFVNYQDQNSPLFQKAFVPTFPGDLNSDVLNDTLPSVSWVLFETALETDEHPPTPPAWGAYEMAQLLAALTANEEVWAKTVLFITWDENGGYFDHVRPPTPPPGTPGEFITASPLPGAAGGIAGPIGLGFRVPLLVVSPFSRGGWVCSDTFDHTSLLRFIETRFGVRVPNLSAWRRSVTGDLTTTLGHHADLTVPQLPATSFTDNPTVLRECPSGDWGTGIPGLPTAGPYPVPPNSMPRQQPGKRRHRP